jgi:hypothetical protein
VLTFDSKAITFFPDGRFTTESASGGSAPGVVIGSRRGNAGTYSLDRHTISMRYADGRVVNTGFYFYPSKGQKTRNALAIGNREYTLQK